MVAAQAPGGWNLVFTKQAQKDAKKAGRAGHRLRVETLLEVLREDPYKRPPPYEKLVGDLAGAYSRRISVQHRLVYCAHKKERVVKVLRIWTHYE